MLIAISGPSSSGKGTTLYNLESFGFQVLHQQYARTLLREHRLTVTELYKKSFDEIRQFHVRLVDLKDKVERPYIHTSSPLLVERTFMDFYVYLTTQTGIEDTDFYRLCVRKTLEFYKLIVYLNECPLVTDDGIRITNTDKINNQKNLFTSIWSSPEFLDRVLSISQMTISDRSNKIISTLKGL